ncbi:MAG TPA: phosphopantetheine-binding protein [Candidatus Angelobacter sp.]|nr:phosphopantetheine-binding protein [Candidatus Angelobacter sp.]
MSELTAETIKEFLLKKFEPVLRDQGFGPDKVTDDFDLFEQGIVDSVGVLNLISDVEKAFDVKLDMEQMDAEQLTIVGPFCRYAAEHSQPGLAEVNGHSANGNGLNLEAVQSDLRNFIRQNYSIAADDRDFTDDVHLYDAGYIDPMGAGSLKTFVESKFAIQLTPADLATQRLNTVRELSTFVLKRRKGEI